MPNENKILFFNFHYQLQPLFNGIFKQLVKNNKKNIIKKKFSSYHVSN